MSTIIDNIKQHISNNRGKYGVATGAGAVYGASQMPTINQAAFNTMAHGQNFALDAADKIGYGKEQLQKLGLENKIHPEAIQSGNDFYNSKLGQYINPSAGDMVNAAEHSSGIYNKLQEAKAQSQEVVNQAQAQGQNYLDQGINYIKGLNPFHENTSATFSIPVKSMLLEGYQPEQITENVNRFLANNNTPQDRIGGIIGGVGAVGLAGGGLAAYGNISNTNRQYKTVDQSLVSDDGSIGPWDKSMLARGQFFNNLDNRASNLYDNNKIQYFLNPFAAGPISHTLIKGSRDINNGLYKALKNNRSPEIQNNVTVISDPTNGPVNAGLDTIRNSANNYADDIATIRRNNPGHYYLNPLVAGPVNEFIGGHLGGAIAQGLRVASSPTSKSGDTLVYNTGRR